MTDKKIVLVIWYVAVIVATLLLLFMKVERVYGYDAAPSVAFHVDSIPITPEPRMLGKTILYLPSIYK